MVNWKSKKLGDLLLLANGLIVVVFINLIASFYFFRIDLTEEKRYTIKQPTRELLKNLDEPVYVEVFLEGDLNAGFKRFQNSIRETLEEFRIYSNGKLQYGFTNPASAMGQKAQSEFMNELASKGIPMLPVIENKDGQRTEKMIFPGALVSYGGIETGVMLFKGNRSQNSQEVLNQSIEGVEYELANVIYKLTNMDRKSVGFTTGHGELDSLQLASLKNALNDQYDLKSVKVNEPIAGCEVLISAKPTIAFNEKEKYELDQFLLRGGKVILLIDRLDAKMDSASRTDYLAFPYDLKLEDQLFKYGVRINMDLVQDRVAGKYPVVISTTGSRPQIMQMDWPFFPLINQYANHPITHNLDASILKFVSSIDTVKAEGVKKTPLLFSSATSRRVNAPVQVSVNDLRKNVSPESFHEGPIALGYLLEGNFTSLYKNRFLPEGADKEKFITEGRSKLIVIADGDLARNDINPRTGQPQQLGLDPFSNYTYANQDLLLHMVSYLADEKGLINVRSKDVKIRPLDKEEIRKNRTYWQFVNLALPLLLLILFGMVRSFWRKKKYASFNA
jgi:ABC-2 type transport system permease protein